MPKAIVTLLRGERQQTLWETHARDSWQAYAKRHDYRLVVHQGRIDVTDEADERSFSWQKLLVFRLPEVRECDRVVWLNHDVLIHANAPDIARSVPAEKMGLAVAHLLLAYPGLEAALERVCGTTSLAEHARHFYEQCSLPAFDYFLNTGVMVLSPAHAEVLEYVYDTYPQQPKSFAEQMALSSVVLERGLHHVLDPRFNAPWYEHKAAFYPFLYGGPAALLPLCLAVVVANNFFTSFHDMADDMKKFTAQVRIEGRRTVVPDNVLFGIVDALYKAARR